MNAIMLESHIFIVKLNVIMLSVIMLSVVVPFLYIKMALFA